MFFLFAVLYSAVRNYIRSICELYNTFCVRVGAGGYVSVDILERISI